MDLDCGKILPHSDAAAKRKMQVKYVAVKNLHRSEPALAKSEENQKFLKKPSKEKKKSSEGVKKVSLIIRKGPHVTNTCSQDLTKHCDVMKRCTRSMTKDSQKIPLKKPPPPDVLKKLPDVTKKTSGIIQKSHDIMKNVPDAIQDQQNEIETAPEVTEKMPDTKKAPAMKNIRNMKKVSKVPDVLKNDMKIDVLKKVPDVVKKCRRGIKNTVEVKPKPVIINCERRSPEKSGFTNKIISIWSYAKRFMGFSNSIRRKSNSREIKKPKSNLLLKTTVAKPLMKRKHQHLLTEGNNQIPQKYKYLKTGVKHNMNFDKPRIPLCKDLKLNYNDFKVNRKKKDTDTKPIKLEKNDHIEKLEISKQKQIVLVYEPKTPEPVEIITNRLSYDNMVNIIKAKNQTQILNDLNTTVTIKFNNKFPPTNSILKHSKKTEVPNETIDENVNILHKVKRVKNVSFQLSTSTKPVLNPPSCSHFNEIPKRPLMKDKGTQFDSHDLKQSATKKHKRIKYHHHSRGRHHDDSRRYSNCRRHRHRPRNGHRHHKYKRSEKKKCFDCGRYITNDDYSHWSYSHQEKHDYKERCSKCKKRVSCLYHHNKRRHHHHSSHRKHSTEERRTRPHRHRTEQKKYLTPTEKRSCVDLRRKKESLTIGTNKKRNSFKNKKLGRSSTNVCTQKKSSTSNASFLEKYINSNLSITSSSSVESLNSSVMYDSETDSRRIEASKVLSWWYLHYALNAIRDKESDSEEETSARSDGNEEEDPLIISYEIFCSVYKEIENVDTGSSEGSSLIEETADFSENPNIVFEEGEEANVLEIPEDQSLSPAFSMHNFEELNNTDEEIETSPDSSSLHLEILNNTPQMSNVNLHGAYEEEYIETPKSDFEKLSETPKADYEEFFETNI